MSFKVGDLAQINETWPFKGWNSWELTAAQLEKLQTKNVLAFDRNVIRKENYKSMLCEIIVSGEHATVHVYIPAWNLYTRIADEYITKL